MVEEHWTLPRYYAMLDCWRAIGPPVHIAVAGYLGLAKGYPDDTVADDETKKYGNLFELEAMFQGGMIE